MVSEVSLFVGPGAGAAEPSVSAGAEGAPGGNFAALVAQASMDAGAADGAQPLEGVINRVFVAEWCLAAPEVETSATIDGTNEEAAETEATGELAEEASEDALTGMLTELVGVPLPMVVTPVAQPVEPVIAGGAQSAAPITTGTPEIGALPDARITPPSTALTGSAGTEADATPATEDGVLPVRASEPAIDAGEPLRTAPEQAFPATRATGTASKREVAQSAHGSEREPAVQEKIPVSAEPSIQRAATAETVEGLSDAAPRARVAAAQLSKAIERVGGNVTGQPFAFHVEGSQGEAASSEHGPGGSSSEDAGPAAAAAARPPAHLPMAAFSSHVVGELQRQAAVVQSSADMLLPGQDVAPDAGTAEQIVQAIRMQFRDGIGDAVIRLKPDHLGEVSVSLRVDHQTVSATVHAEVPAVRQWLESQESVLRNNLSEQGLHLDKFAVREDESGHEHQERDDADRARKAPRPLRSGREEDEPRFEVVV